MTTVMSCCTRREQTCSLPSSLISFSVSALFSFTWVYSKDLVFGICQKYPYPWVSCLLFALIGGNFFPSGLEGLS